MLAEPRCIVRFEAKEHVYWAWSPRSERWHLLASVSQVMTRSGFKRFDFSNWRRALLRQGIAEELVDDYMKQHANKRARIGTATHDLIRARLLDTGPGTDFTAIAEDERAEAREIAQVIAGQFLPMAEAVLLVERPLAHGLLAFAGTPDLLVVIDGRIFLVDWKTKPSESKARVSDEWVAQLAAYRELCYWNYGVRADGAINVMAWPDGLRLKRWNAADLNAAWYRFMLEALLPYHQANGAYPAALTHTLSEIQPCSFFAPTRPPLSPAQPI